MRLARLSNICLNITISKAASYCLRQSERGAPNMFLSPEEFKKLVSKNPAIRIRDNRQPHTASSVRIQDSAIADEVKSGKYKNVKVYVHANGMVSHQKDIEKNGKVIDIYDSTKEYLRGCDLKILERAGKIRSLQRQKTWKILDAFTYQGAKIKGIGYKADFQYEKEIDGVWVTVVEDVKPYDEKSGKFRTTEAFNLKWKLLKNQYRDIHFVLF